jgi:hypothetical protein
MHCPRRRRRIEIVSMLVRILALQARLTEIPAPEMRACYCMRMSFQILLTSGRQFKQSERSTCSACPRPF